MSDQVAPVRWGVLGTARIATKVGAAIRRTEGAELAVIGSRDASRAAAWAAEHRASRSVGSYEAVLDDPEIDAVYIPLPPSMHREWTIKAAERGKHVLCEKPLAPSYAEAEELVAACRERRVQFMDGVMWYHHPRAADMQRPLRDGRVGELKRVTSAFSFCWDELPRDEFRLDREHGGGSLLDLGWYCVGLALWTFQRLPQRVFGQAKFHNDVDLEFTGGMWFDEGRASSFDCGFQTSFRRWMEVAGKKGSLVCDDFTRPWQAEKPRFWLHDGTGSGEEVVSASPIQEECMIAKFCELVRTGVREDAWGQLALDTQRVCGALDRSAREDRVVEVS